MCPTTQVSRISAEQYRALQHPVVALPSPQQLFDQIVETLVAKELATYEHADPFRNNLPDGLFLLIPPRHEEPDLEHLVDLIEMNVIVFENNFENTDGAVNLLNPRDLTDKVAVPKGPYLMTEVDDGKLRLGAKPLTSEQDILAECRSPYVTFEGIIHSIVFPEVLASHNIDLCGSRYKSVGVPYLCLNDKWPELNADWDDIASPEWGAPSCKDRIGA